MMDAPSKNARRSRAQKVVDKAKRTNAAQGNVKNLPTTRLERGVVDGRPTLTAIFSKKGGGEPDRLDLTFLLEFSGLTELFADGILQWGKSLKQISRIEDTKTLRSRWFTYLIEQRLANLVPSEFNEQIMSGFKTWLHQKLKADGKPLHPKSIGRALGVLRNVLRSSPGAGKWLDLVPEGPRGASRKTDPTEVLQFDQLLSVMAAVEKEVLALRDRWEDGRRLLAQGQIFRQQGGALCRNPREREEARVEANVALALAMLDLRYSGVIPDRVVIQADDPLLAATIDYAIGSAKANGYFYASARDLVPLALSIAFATVFNPDTVLKLCWKNIDRNVDRLSNGRPAVQFDVSDEEEVEEEVAETEASGAPLTKVTGDKARAKRQLVRLLDPQASGPDQVSLNLVLDLLTAMTARIRPQVINHEEHGDRVFLFVQKVSQKRPKGYGDSSHGACADITWQHGLRRFIADNELPAFTLKTIRSTLLDYTQLFNRGDLEAARQVGNHGSRVITWTHYTSNLVKRLLQEATGETMLVRERWLLSDGKLDPRKFRAWTDKGCATPGWVCLDPFDSPRPNQKKGRLCMAYGECPDCPLAAARQNNPRNVMLYEALRRAIYRSVTRVTASVWRERWAPVVAALDGLLSHVPARVLQESRKLSAELPEIG
jgi:hypothetical protein